MACLRRGVCFYLRVLRFLRIRLKRSWIRGGVLDGWIRAIVSFLVQGGFK